MIKINGIPVERKKMIKYSKYFEIQSKDYFKKEEEFEIEIDDIRCLQYVLDCIDYCEGEILVPPYLRLELLGEVELLREYLGLRNFTDKLDFPLRYAQQFNLDEIIPKQDIDLLFKFVKKISGRSFVKKDVLLNSILEMFYIKLKSLNLWIIFCEEISRRYNIKMKKGDYITISGKSNKNYETLFFDGKQLISPFSSENFENIYPPEQFSDEVGINFSLDYWKNVVDTLPFYIKNYKDVLAQNLKIVLKLSSFSLYESSISIGLRDFAFYFYISAKEKLEDEEDLINLLQKDILYFTNTSSYLEDSMYFAYVEEYNLSFEELIELKENELNSIFHEKKNRLFYKTLM